MSTRDTTDDEIIGQARVRERRRKWLVYLIAIVAAVGGLSIYHVDHGRMNPALWWSIGSGCLLALFASIWWIWKMRPPAAAFEARIVAKRTDEIQRSRARMLWLFPIEVLLLAPLIVRQTQYVLERRENGLLGLPRGIASTGYLVTLTLCLVVLMATTLANLVGAGYPKAIRSVMDDELSRAHRAKAVTSGFVASCVGGLLAFFAGLIEPQWAVLALPFVIMGSLAVAAVHFVVLDRQADVCG